MGKSETVPESETVPAMHTLPPLPYAYDALEPHIDARTMMLHHDKHHASYVEKLNAALDKHPEFRARPAAWLLLNPSKIPEDIRTAVHNNAGGHVNHSLFWRAMSPDGGGEPTGALADAIKRDFGGFAKFKKQFDEAGEKAFGSAWVWLAMAKHGGNLKVLTTSGHDNPMTQAYFSPSAERRLGARLLPQARKPPRGLPQRLVGGGGLAGSGAPLRERRTGPGSPVRCSNACAIPDLPSSGSRIAMSICWPSAWRMKQALRCWSPTRRAP